MNQIPAREGSRGIFSLLSAAAALALAGCGNHGPKAPEAPAPKVEGERVIFPADAPQLTSLAAEPAEPRSLAITHLTGRLYWSDDTTVRVFTPVIGQVMSVRANVGQAVEAGTPLAEINSPDFGQALADARTAAGNRAAAEKAFARVRDLYEHGAAAQKDVDAAEAAAVAAAAEQDRTEARLALYGGNSKAEGELFILRSPVPGVVVEKNINRGQQVRNDQMLANAPNLYAPLFVVGDPERLWLQLDAAESDLSYLQPGQKLRVYSKAFPGRAFPGAIDYIGAEMDPATRTVKVRGVVQNPDKLLKAEMYVTVDVEQNQSGTARTIVEVPSKAIFMLENQYYLFIEAAPGNYSRQRVKIGIEKDGKIPVLEGVSAGQRVVTEGALLLQSIIEPAD